MKKIAISLLALLAFNSYAADTVEVEFKGTLINPTCTASFVGNNGSNIEFPSVQASTFASKVNGEMVSSSAIPASIQFSNCSSTLNNIKMTFLGSNTSWKGYAYRSTYLGLAGRASGSSSRLAVALFRTASATAETDAIVLDTTGGDSNVIKVNKSALTGSGSVLSFPLYARLVLGNNERYISDSVGQLSGGGTITFAYE